MMYMATMPRRDPAIDTIDSSYSTIDRILYDENESILIQSIGGKVMNGDNQEIGDPLKNGEAFLKFTKHTADGWKCDSRVDWSKVAHEKVIIHRTGKADICINTYTVKISYQDKKGNDQTITTYYSDHKCPNSSHHSILNTGVSLTTNNNTCNPFSGAAQCMGFAKMVYTVLYGESVGSGDEYTEDSEWEPQAGDYVRYGNHSIIIRRVNEEGTFTVSDCNRTDSNFCIIRWNSIIPVESEYTCVTRIHNTFVNAYRPK